MNGICLASMNSMLFTLLFLLNFNASAGLVDISEILSCYGALSEKNQKFYQSFPYEVYDNKLGWGWHAHQDIEQVAEVTKAAKKFIEIGGGVGRNVKGILKYNPNAEIQVIELNPNSAQSLHSKFKDNPNITIHHASILDPNLKIEKQDLAMWMFSGLLDLGHDEQAAAFRQVSKMVRRHGYFVVDIPNRESNRHPRGQQKVQYDMTPEVYNLYLPTHNQIVRYGIDNGFVLIQKKYYKLNGDLEHGGTNHKFPRISYLLSETKLITTNRPGVEHSIFKVKNGEALIFSQFIISVTALGFLNPCTC